MKTPAKTRLLDKRKLSNTEWQSERSNYLGGSDMASIMHVNQFESALECFHRKIGVVGHKPETLSTYSGHIMESVIYENYWKYYSPINPTEEQLVENAVAGRVIRKAQRFNFTIISEEFPWLGANLDYVIQKNEYTPVGILDCKNNLKWVSNQFIGELAPAYVIQKQDYMIVTGWDYAEICALLDGRFPKVTPINADSRLQEHIIRMSKEFWLMVLEGRKIWSDTSMTEYERLQELSSIEPEVDGGVALEDYLKERFKISGKKGRIQGSAEVLEVAKNYLACNEKINTIEEEKRLNGNLIRKLFLDNGVDEVMFGDKVLMSYRSIDGKSPVLRISKDCLKIN